MTAPGGLPDGLQPGDVVTAVTPEGDAVGHWLVTGVDGEGRPVLQPVGELP
jgi:hypothetical protein